jgi:hypothetical protein
VPTALLRDFSESPVPAAGQRRKPFGQGLLYYRPKVDASSASMSITNTYFVAFVSVPCYLLECIVYSLHNTNDCSYILVIAGLEVTFVLPTCIIMLVSDTKQPATVPIDWQYHQAGFRT